MKTERMNLYSGGLIMVRIFGLLLALVASVQSANAALLATWDFATDASGRVASGISGTAGAMSNAGPFTGTGSPVRTYGNNGARQLISGAGVWRTSDFNNIGSGSTLAARYSFLSFTNSSTVNLVKMTSLQLLARNAVGTTGRSVVVSYKVTGAGSETALATFDRTSTTFSSGSTGFSGVTLNPGDTLTVYFRFFKDAADNTTTNRRLDLDDIKLNGDIVPEPASMAVFGLVGLGVAVARRRKK
ncbi:MAG: hypothetical protein RL069_940 [Planctomycetota bacterium]